MKKYLYTHRDGSEEIITSRFTMKELIMIDYALQLTFDDVCMNEDNEKVKSNELRKAMYVLSAKCELKGVTNKKYYDFVDKYIP